MNTRSGSIILTLTVLLTGFAAAVHAATPAPIFHLSFEKGLVPDIGPAEACQWAAQGDSATATAPPRFDERGLTGRALLIDDNPAAAGYIPIPQPVVDRIKDRGTILFWVRGLENWDLWTVGHHGAWANFLCLGGGMIYKWCWYGELALFGHGPTLFYPQFDQYQWTQLGVSWQREGDGKTRNRIFLDGRLAGETTGHLNVDGLRFGSHGTAKGARHLVDDLTIYDRPLTESEVKRIWRRDFQFANQPVVTVPRLNSAPAIDGKLNPAEWAGAARITGLLDAGTGELAADQSAFYLGYDATHLYVAMRGEMTESARANPALVIERFLRAEATGRADKVADDDTVEIMVAPDYWQTDDHRVPGNWKEYRLLANAGRGFSAVAHGPDGIDANWKIDWETASTAGAGGWQFEARIPFAAFGTNAPAPGDRWGLQLGRVWKHLKEEHDVWAWGVRPLADAAVSAKRRARVETDPPVPEQPDPLQRVRLPLAGIGVLQFAGPATPVVHVDRLGELARRQVDFQATLTNPGPAEQTVKIRLVTDTDELVHEESLALPAGATKEFRRPAALNNFATSRLTFAVLDAGGQLLHRTAVPFFLEQAFEVHTVQYPNYQKLLVEFDLSAFAAAPLDKLTVDLALTDAAGKTVLEKKGERVSAYFAAWETGTEQIAPGDYAVSVTVRTGRKVLARQQQSLTLHPQAPWWDNRYGYDDVDADMVPYPWTNMQLTNDTIQVWGRAYQFGNGLFPEQITTLDRPILRAPIRLVARLADGTVLDSAVTNAQGQWSKTNQTRVEGQRVIEAAGLSLRNRFWAEYDGLLWNALTIAPTPELTIASIELEIPFTKEFTDVINCPGIVVGKFKPEGATGEVRNIWLGNGDGGLQWLLGDGLWHVNDPRQALRVEATPDGATLRLVLLDKPTAFTASYELEFGLIATPVRPKTWRTPEHPSDRGYLIGGGPWYPQGLEFMPAADPGTDFYSGGVGGRIYVHVSPVNTGTDAAGTADYKLYGAEWLEDPSQRPTSQQTIANVTTKSKSLRDYFVWRHWRYQQKYRFAGLYYDNPCGYTLGTRDVMKRLYNIALLDHRYAGRDHIIGIAANGNLNMGYMGFAMYHWDGEQFNSAIGDRQPTYRGLLDPDVFRAEFMGHNFGWTVMFLGQGRLKPEWVAANGGPEAVIDQLQGLELLHDSPPTAWHIAGPLDQVCNRAVEAYQKYRLSHWVYQFLPYWHQDVVSLPSPNMYASFYLGRPSLLKAGDAINGWYHAQQFQNYFDKHLPDFMKVSNFHETEPVRTELETRKDRAVMIVYNNSDWEGALRLKPDWQKLGLGAPETLRAENAVHSTGFRIENDKPVFFPKPEETARIEGDELIFPMTRWNYRMIVLEAQ